MTERKKGYDIRQVWDDDAIDATECVYDEQDRLFWDSELDKFVYAGFDPQWASKELEHWRKFSSNPELLEFIQMTKPEFLGWWVKYTNRRCADKLNEEGGK
jgi:hypothetical protein